MTNRGGELVARGLWELCVAGVLGSQDHRGVGLPRVPKEAAGNFRRYLARLKSAPVARRRALNRLRFSSCLLFYLVAAALGLSIT